VAYIDRGQPFHRGAGCLCLLGSRHSVAALFPGMDVHCNDCAGLARQPLGAFHRNFRRWLMGLHKRFRDKLFLEWAAASLTVDSHRARGATGSADCGTGMVVQFACGHWLRLGIQPSRRETRQRYCEILGLLRSDYWILRSGHGDFPATLLGTFSSATASSLAVVTSEMAD
jgi:hypothetical protein